MKNIACFDVGGTFIKYAVINSGGEILLKHRFPSPLENCRETIPESILLCVKELQKGYKLDSIGICTAGQVDSGKGAIIFATDNLPEYTGARLSEKISRGTGLITYVENDVNAAALGEMWMGSARGKKTFVCITLGTGIGGAIVIDGKIFKGVKHGAGEIGHIIINENGEMCNCGSAGCYERYASTSALVRKYIEKAGNKSIDISDMNGEKIIEKAQSGEPLAHMVYNEFLDHIVTGIISITYLLDPGLIIIGGGISSQGVEFTDELNIRFKRRIMKSYAEHTSIIPAGLQNDAGIYGACFIALNGQ